MYFATPGATEASMSVAVGLDLNGVGEKPGPYTLVDAAGSRIVACTASVGGIT